MGVHVHFLSAQFNRIDTPQGPYRYASFMPWVSIRSSQRIDTITTITVDRIDTVSTPYRYVWVQIFFPRLDRTLDPYGPNVSMGVSILITVSIPSSLPIDTMSKSSPILKCSWDVSIHPQGIDPSQACVSIRLEDVSIRCTGCPENTHFQTHANHATRPQTLPRH